MKLSDHPVSRGAGQLTPSDYQALAAFRHALRRFVAFSEREAVRAGLMPQQHQALLAIKAMGASDAPSVGALAGQLMIRPHSAAELIGRLVKMGLVERRRDAGDRRRVHVSLLPLAEQKLAELSSAHLRELAAIRPLMDELFGRFDR